MSYTMFGSSTTYPTFKGGSSQNFSSHTYSSGLGGNRQSTATFHLGVGSSGAFLSPGFRYGDAVHRMEKVSTNSSLLEPLDLEIDPSIQMVRNQEKEQIKSLNNRFASFIEQVRSLEQHNKMLEVKWKLLQEQTTSHTNYDAFYEGYINKLQKELAGLDHEKVRLESDLHQLTGLVQDYREKYEDEINKHQKCEEEYLFLKKDFDGGYVMKVELEVKRQQLADEIEFYRQLYEAEIRDLQSQIQDTTVVVEMDNSRKLDMDAIVADVRAQYEDIAKRSRAEAEVMYKTKFAEMQESAGRYGDDLKSTKAEIADMKRKILRLQSEIDMVKTQQNNLQNQIGEAENNGEKLVKNARKQLKELEDALQRDKHNMAFQVRQYQELMNVKLALDIEIATYRKLLEGEESRLEIGIKTNLTKQKAMNFSNYSMESSRTPMHLSRPSDLVKAGGFHATAKDGVAVKSTTYTTTETTVIKTEEKTEVGDDDLKFHEKTEDLLPLELREEEHVEKHYSVEEEEEEEEEEKVETMAMTEE